MSMRFKYLSLSVTIFVSMAIVNCLHGQSNNITVKKERSDKSSGSYLRIIINHPQVNFDSKIDQYKYEYVSKKLPDSIKLYLIGQLFKFITDTSICSNQVYGYPNFAYDGCYYKSAKSKQFSIGVESLFVINRIAYFTFINRISCYPVLFDTYSQEEVNFEFSALFEMKKHYKEWYDKCQLTGKINPDFRYLSSGKIRWWGSHL